MADLAETLSGLDAAKLLRLVKADSRPEELSPLRRLAWALLLRVVKGDSPAQWVQELNEHRKQYRDLVALHREELDIKKFDASIANPLSRNAANPFLKKQANDELLQEIWKDIERTYPEVPMLQEERSRKAMQQVLFHWCKANNPAKDASESYRQGMNELAAVFYYTVRCGEHTGLSSPAADLCGSEHSEADTFVLFSHLMEAGLRDMFAVEKGGARRLEKSPIGDLPLARTRPSPERGQPQSAILARCAFIFDAILKTVDEPLHRCIQQHGIEPQLFLLRWLRLLFCREFHLEDTLVIWDAIFLDGFDSPGLGSLRYAKGGGPAAEKAEAASLALPLVDYTAVAMLSFIRQELIGGDESDCLHRLLKFPPVENVRYFPELAARLRAGARCEGPLAAVPASESASTVSDGTRTAGGTPAPSAAPAAVSNAVAAGTGGGHPTRVPPSPLGGAKAPTAAPGPLQASGGGLLDKASTLFDVGKQALIDAKQRVSQFAGEVGGEQGPAPGARPGGAAADHARQPEAHRSLFGDEPVSSPSAGAASPQVHELQRRLAAVEQERDTIKKKASEFVQAKKAEWSARASELEAQLARSEERVKGLEGALRAAGDTERQAKPADDTGLREEMSTLRSRLAAAEAEAAEVPILRRQFAEVEERLSAAVAQAREVPDLRARLREAEERLAAAATVHTEASSSEPT